MAWTYDATDLGVDTASGRLNSVRLLVGDTVSTAQQLQDEEITFALARCGDNIYLAGSFVAGVLAAKYSRDVNTNLGGAINESNSDLSKAYLALKRQLKAEAQRGGASTLGVTSGDSSGLTDTDPAFTMDQFDYYGNVDASSTDYQ